MGNCCRRKSNSSPLSILLLGVDNAGKTEIGHILAGVERLDFSITKGIRVFNINVNRRAIKLMEIGGAESVRDLWPHYYNEAHGIIYVIDCNKDANFDLMRELLQIMMRHKHVRQKPLLIVANKQDLSDSLDLVDITYYFHIDEIANLLGTPSFIATCGHSNHSDLFIGIEWLVGYIVANFHVLTNRIRFNRSILSPVVKLKRQMTSRPRKSLDVRLRVRSAPLTFNAERNRHNGMRNNFKVAPVQLVHPATTETENQQRQESRGIEQLEVAQLPAQAEQQKQQKPDLPMHQPNVISIQHQ